MAKKHYMALDDVQSLWNEKLKPAIPSMFEKEVIEGYLNPTDGKLYATRTAVEEGGEFVEWQYSDEITGASDKLYAEKDSSNILYRFTVFGFSRVGIYYNTATPSTSGTGGTDGLMSAADKEKLNGIDAAVGNIIIPLQIIQKAGLITEATETIVDNPEFCTVLLDADDKIVMGIRHDLTVVGADVEDAFEFVMEQL